MASPSEDPDADLTLFLTRLASALNTVGLPVDQVQRRVEAVGRHYGVDHVATSAFPTFVMVASDGDHGARMEVTPMAADTPVLDRIGRIERVTTAAESGSLTVAEGLRRLDEIDTTAPRFGPTVSVLGTAILAAGLCLVLRPTRSEVAESAALGLVVGVLRLVVQRSTYLRVLTPVIAAFAVAALAALGVRSGWLEIGIRPIVASLVLFLPGATLTTSVLELGSGQVVAGASRLVSGILSLALLAFGILAGIEVVGATPGEVLAGTGDVLGAWTAWLGVGLFAVGVTLAFSSPPLALGGLLVVLYAAWVAQLVGNAWSGSFLGACFGAIVLVIAAHVLARLPATLPPHASFLPGFWLLVPGSLGLIGLTLWAGTDGTSPTTDLQVTAGTIFSVAVGVLIGTQVCAWAADTLRLVRARSQHRR